MRETRLVRARQHNLWRGLAKTALLAFLVACAATAAVELEAHAVEIEMSITPCTTYIYQSVDVLVHVQTTSDTVTFASDSTTGTFGSVTGQVVGATDKTYSVKYTPGKDEAGVTTLTATHADGSMAKGILTVELRPTQTILEFSDTDGVFVYQDAETLTVKVEDTLDDTSANVHPTGSVTLEYETASKKGGTREVSLTSNSDFTNTDADPDRDGHKWEYSYRWTCLGAAGVDADKITAVYDPDDGVHEASEGGYGISVSRRPTKTTVECVADTNTDLDSPFTVLVTVAEDMPTADGGPAQTIYGDLILLDSSSTVDLDNSAVTGTDTGKDAPATGKEVSVPSNGQPVAMPTIEYVPSSGCGVHIASMGTPDPEFPCKRTIDTEVDSTNVGANCNDGCGGGPTVGVNVPESILIMNEEITLLQAVQDACELATIITSLIPDPVWAAGFGVSSGSEIPVKEIINAIFEGTNLALEIAIQIMEADWDGDGIPNVVEDTITGTDDEMVDTDGDGLGDMDEIEEAGGYFAECTTGPCAVRPNPNVSDSDNDGLGDGDEASIYHTNFCVWDTDCDGVSDGKEADFDTGTWSYADIRDHADPLMQDTDGDGLSDFVEIDAGCPYVNDDDSDDDGLQDGYEDKDGDGIETGVIGDTGTAASGETDYCDPDTDHDGLLDGEEEDLFGQGPLHDGVVGVATESGLITETEPALDKDSDDDGLSDYEEVVVTHTNPLCWDTDGDDLSDQNELLPTGGTYPKRTFAQVSDPLDPDTDDDGLGDLVEFPGGTGMGTSNANVGGHDDLTCPYVNDADSDDDGLQDGVEDADHDGVWDVPTIGSFTTQAEKPGDYWETDPCNPDTDGDGLLDGEEVTLLGGGPISQRPADWPNAQQKPGFNTVTPEAVSTVGPVGPNYSGGALYAFTPVSGAKDSANATVPALDVDTDNDGLSDYEEVNTTGTNPLDADSDNDTIADGDELIATGGTYGAHPQRSFDQESDPLDINTDDDYLFDPVEGSCGNSGYAGTGLSTRAGALGGLRDTACPYVNNADSDDDGIQDGAVVVIAPPGAVDRDGNALRFTHYEAFRDVEPAGPNVPGIARITPEAGDGEQYNDSICNVCDADSDGDGLNDGEEVAIGTNPDDWDTDNDGRSDWHEVTGGGPIPTDPFDPDTDDDGLLDSAEVFGTNPTNPVNADTDGDGLCDGGAGTPWMTSTDVRVVVNPVCKSCSTPGLNDCGTSSTRTGSPDGIGDHPNRFGFGEDQNGNGAWDRGENETDPNQYDTDGDAIADGIERLSFSTSRDYMIPPKDLLGREILVTYPEANNLKNPCGCLDPLNADSDGDGLSDGYEDANHDGNFDFLPSDFDIDTSSVETSLPDPEETNPCVADTDGDNLTDWEERFQRQPLAYNPPLPVDNDGDGLIDEDPIDGIDNDGDGRLDEDPAEGPIELTFNPTNPLDWDTDNDWLSDGQEVHWPCVATEYTQLDNDTDGYINEDWVDGLDNDGDGLFDEDPVDFWVRFVPMLDPTNRDSDSDGFIDGLDEDPCNSEMIPLIEPAVLEPVDSDGDGFSDDDEIAAGTHPNDPEDHPTAYGTVDVDFDECIDDRIWLEPGACCGEAGWVVVDLDNNVLIDLRIAITSKSVKHGDFDKDGYEDDVRYTVEYVLSDYRAVQLRGIATIDDYNSDLVIDRVVVERK